MQLKVGKQCKRVPIGEYGNAYFVFRDDGTNICTGHTNLIEEFLNNFYFPSKHPCGVKME